MRTAAALVLALTLPLAGTACAAGTEPADAPTSSAVPGPAARLPTPTGSFGVGRNLLHLVDNARPDPWLPAQPRELMVSMYYPAHHDSGPRTPYATEAEIGLMLDGTGLTGVPAQALSRAGTNSTVDADPVEGTYPLVVLSPGFTAPRYTLTSLAEEVASRGYVVAAVDHAGESFGTEFPGGRMSTCLACEKATTPAGFALVAETRAHDISFLLDRLTGKEPSWPHAGLIDATRIGMAGHSIGGASAVAAMALDPRIHAGVNMDGSFQGTVPATGLGDRPFLLLGADDQSSPGGSEPSWDEAWSRLHGWKRWLTLAGADHESFIDTGALAEQLGLPGETPLRNSRALDLTRTYVAAFFDQHLRGTDSTLLNNPDPTYPEVRFHNP
ncbi:alpha/beta hydrolase family protein [Nocardia sp. NPDC020380]|uniref:alpha/beta hydrolase family protein n=1 Tax=Nocardia sp. NPDC020380 TaxID=3364309 RepID=UPI003795A00A